MRDAAQFAKSDDPPPAAGTPIEEICFGLCIAISTKLHCNAFARRSTAHACHDCRRLRSQRGILRAFVSEILAGHSSLRTGAILCLRDSKGRLVRRWLPQRAETKLIRSKTCAGRLHSNHREDPERLSRHPHRHCSVLGRRRAIARHGSRSIQRQDGKDVVRRCTGCGGEEILQARIEVCFIERAALIKRSQCGAREVRVEVCLP